MIEHSISNGKIYLDLEWYVRIYKMFFVRFACAEFTEFTNICSRSRVYPYRIPKWPLMRNMDDKQMKEENDIKTLLHVHELLLFQKLLFCRSFFCFSFFASVTCSRHNRCVRTVCVCVCCVWLFEQFYTLHSTTTISVIFLLFAQLTYIHENPLDMQLTTNLARSTYFFFRFSSTGKRNNISPLINWMEFARTLHMTERICMRNTGKLNWTYVYTTKSNRTRPCRYDFKPNRRCTQLFIIIIFTTP